LNYTEWALRHHDGAQDVLQRRVACIAWPVVARTSSAPRWQFFSLAIAVTLVLLLPDLYILKQGQPAKVVAGLMCMHVAIGLVTYNALVRSAPVKSRLGRGGVHGSDLQATSPG
jgi:hypothetical protein